MDVKTKFFIYQTDIPDLEFKIRLIDGRQDFGPMGRNYYYTNNILARTDMFWIEVTCDGREIGFFAVENSAAQHDCDPTFFDLVPQGFEIESEGACFSRRIRTFWMESPEYQQQQEWVAKLSAFIRDVRKPAPNTGLRKTAFTKEGNQS